MGLMDIVFGPYERFGERGGIVILVVVAIVGAIIAGGLTVIGVQLLAAVSFVIAFTFTYGVLFLFLYLMWYRRPR